MDHIHDPSSIGHIIVEVTPDERVSLIDLNNIHFNMPTQRVLFGHFLQQRHHLTNRKYSIDIMAMTFSIMSSFQVAK